ncbi:hypothetical protein [Pseudomonas sp. SC3(2021)]|uniref:hypothetical protein n=1 Tax=Pseudomonas sp. SC3(2021) TaxID=2871493 RepID=UPI001C9D73A2|nr:hypothetical protein [Pseudomonas sp. SC3(2021)]
MKRVTTMLLTVTAAVLLGGCVADFDEGHRHGRHYDRDHERYYDHDRRWDDWDDDRRDGRRYYRDRDDD